MTDPIITINVKTHEAQVLEGAGSKVVMIPFSAEATGRYFCGRTVQDGVDTQYITESSFTLSARYMLEGTDCGGKACRLYIENNGTSMDSCKPKIVTDSRELAFLETADLLARVEGGEGGVIVKIYTV